MKRREFAVVTAADVDGADDGAAYLTIRPAGED
jgi:hypothetical protein